MGLSPDGDCCCRCSLLEDSGERGKGLEDVGLDELTD